MRLLALIACAVMIGAAAPSQPPPSDQPAGEGRETSSAEASRPPASPTAPTSTIRKFENRPAAEARANGQKAKADPPNWTEVGGFVVGVVGLAGLAATVLYAKRAWKAAEKSAKAADDTFKAAVASEQRELRAYVHSVEMLRKGYATRTAGDKKIPGMIIATTWKNLGATPARRIVSGVGGRLFKGRIPSDFDFPDVGGASPSAPLGPGAYHYATVFASIEDIREGQVAGNGYYVWFSINYSDVFPGAPRRRTETCARVIVEGDPADPESKMEWEIVPDFNGTDEECRRHPKGA